MAYKIEDIDWSKMPEGAVRFSLEDEDYNFTWYNKAGEYKTSPSSKWHDDAYDDGRKRYKVKDYILVVVKQNASREERLEKALDKLMTKHFHGKELEWCSVGGVCLLHKDPELHSEIINLLSEIRDSKNEHLFGMEYT